MPGASPCNSGSGCSSTSGVGTQSQVGGEAGASASELAALWHSTYGNDGADAASGAGAGAGARSSIGFGASPSQGSFKPPSPPIGGGYNDTIKSVNREVLLEAFASLSLHDKCALSLGMCRDLAAKSGKDPSALGISSLGLGGMGMGSGSKRKKGGAAVGEIKNGDGQSVSLALAMAMGSLSPRSPETVAGDVKKSQLEADLASVISESEMSDTESLGLAMKLMGDDELNQVQAEALNIQHDMQGWLLRHSYTNMRRNLVKLQGAIKEKYVNRNHAAAKVQGAIKKNYTSKNNAAVNLQGAIKTIQARKGFLDTRSATTTLQAATRGMLARQSVKRQAIASLVLQVCHTDPTFAAMKSMLILPLPLPPCSICYDHLRPLISVIYSNGRRVCRSKTSKCIFSNRRIVFGNSRRSVRGRG